MTQPDEAAQTIPPSYGLAALDPPTPMLILERDFRIRWISSAAIRELRLQPEMLIGRSWYDLFPESRSRRALHEALCRGERDAIDLPCIPLSLGCGTQYFSLRLRPLYAPDGSVESILGLGEDVTARVQAERALVASEERFRAISTHSRDMVIISTADGTVTFESEAVERILGPRRPSRPVISIYDNMHPEDLPLAKALFEKLVNDPSVGVLKDIEVRKRHKDGSWRWLQFTASNMLDCAAVRGVALNGRDVTERKVAEIRCVASEQKLASALWGAQAIYWSTDLETDTSEISDNFFTITGIDRRSWEADVEPWCTWVHRDDAPMGCARYRAHLAGGTDVFEHEYRMQTPSGWKWLLDHGKVVERDSAGRPLRMAGTTTDISARKALERSLVDALNQEQRRVSRALHEGVAQSLIGIALLVASVSRKCQTDRPDIRQDLEDVSTELRIAAEETRSLVRGFLPASIERGDVGTALRELAAELSLNNQISVKCDTSGWGFRQIPAEAAQHVYATAQQALRNAIECAHATSIIVVLCVDVSGRLVLVLSDNRLSSVSTGLESDEFNHKVMAYRAQALGGTLVQEPNPTGGRQITLCCPIARPCETSSKYKTERGFCDCIPLHDRNIHLGRRKSVIEL